MRHTLQFGGAALLAAALVAVAGCSQDTSTPVAVPSNAQSMGKETQGGDALPQAVVDGVNQAYPGATFVSARRERENGRTYYDVNITTASGEDLEVEVQPDGTITETERGHDRDDEADDADETEDEDESEDEGQG
ncbi:MAG: hypothetical protein AB1505_04005 [Candidatus Latescibacterota bacterium]